LTGVALYLAGAGQKLSLLGIAQPGWFVARACGGGESKRAGLVPANYLQVLVAPH
jgi:hypothetical protein